MDEKIAISLRDVSKKYRLYNSPKERLFEALHPFKKKYHREFWALKNINFEILKGETVGIIGRNGAGKSTLLQLICSVLRPTSGHIHVDGRISSLLELGGGFNPEFTGRENVLLNGQMSGLSLGEMKRRLPEIKAFADISEFFDQPVKIYSSGMFVRLAFAAAIHVDPDILIIDEALAVGDAKFQNKCFNKFIEFQNNRKTIFFVSHDMNLITRHCSKVILIENGSILDIGNPFDMTKLYTDLLFTGKTKKCLSGTSPEKVRGLFDKKEFEKASEALGSISEISSEKGKTGLDIFLESVSEVENAVNRRSYNKNEYRIGNGNAVIVDYFITTDDKEDVYSVPSGSNVHLYLKTSFRDEVPYPNYGFAINTLDGVLVYGTQTSLMNIEIPSVEKATISIIKFTFTLNLNKGDYFFDVGVGNTCDEPLDWRGNLIHLVVHDLPSYIHTGIVDCRTTFMELSEHKVG